MDPRSRTAPGGPTAPAAGSQHPRATRPGAPRRPGGGSTVSASAARPAAAGTEELSEDHRHLTLDALRSYRQALQDEEGRVSYWRRILQARLDVVRAGRRGGGTDTMDVATLRPVLVDRRVGAGRTALLTVLPADDIPPLPDLAELWERRVQDGDDPGLQRLEEDLSRAEQQLSAYRAVLHGRLSGATSELIARYRLQPTLCLSSLPL